MSPAVEDEPEGIGKREVRVQDAEEDVGKDVGDKPAEVSSSRSNGPEVKKIETGKKEEEEEKPKPSKIKGMWAKLDLDLGTLMMMFK